MDSKMIKEIQQDFNKVISYSQDISIEDLNTDMLFKEWEKNKMNLYKKFGNKLIFEFPVEVMLTLSDSEQKQYIEHFISFLDDIPCYSGLYDFIKEQQDCFFKNKIEKSSTLSPEITVGMKISKAFKFFVTDPEDLKIIQEEYSRIIQLSKVKGTLCLSIHPLDYLSVSENNNNWRSCHALDGEYRSGNLNYMIDNNTIVAYLKGKEDVTIGNFPSDVPWNSKKWRSLIFMNDNQNLIALGRQYPFFTYSIFPFLTEALKMVNIIDYGWVNYWTKAIKYIEIEDVTKDGKMVKNKLSLEYPHGEVHGAIVNFKDIIKENPFKNYYNDLLHSSCYEPFFTIDRLVFKNYLLENPIKIGKDAPCLSCGKNIIEDNDIMLCPGCALEKGEQESDRFATCGKCGTRFWRQQGTWDFTKDALICPSCAGI